MPSLTARWYGDLSRRLHLEDGFVRRVETDLGELAEGELLACEPLVDIQMNGRWGVSFSDPTLTVDQVSAIFQAQAPLGTGLVCPTLITASPEATFHGIRTICQAVGTDPLVARMFGGIHLEGPWISEKEGFRGAHPLSAVRDPDLDEFARWFDAADGRIAIVTLAPERPGSIEAIRRLVSLGVVVAVGHSSADGETLRRATDAGASLATHIGNGVASTLPRHPNPIWDQIANPALRASFIADGYHVDLDILWTMIRAKSLDRSILISDFSPLAGLPSGVYGPWEVLDSRKIIVAGTPYLAGANLSLFDCISRVFRTALERIDTEEVADFLPRLIHTATLQPAALTCHQLASPQVNAKASLVLFRREGKSLELVGTFLHGEWFAPGLVPAPWRFEASPAS